MALNDFNTFPSSDPINEYGSDWDDDIIDELVSTATNLTGGSDVPLIITDIEDYETPNAIRLPRISEKESPSAWRNQQARKHVATSPAQALRQVAYSESSTKVAASESNDQDQRQREVSVSSEPEGENTTSVDTRPPLERFRGPPKKALSVTDLVSPAWCELQYFYTLAKHGRKRRTPAMKQGSKIHKQLEDEVHETVPVTIKTKADGWGLRIWNIIQSLRTLKETGRTREMEVWGLVDGQLVNGVIDELSYTMPAPTKKPASKMLPTDQTSITEYLKQYAGGSDIATAMDQQSKTGDFIEAVSTGGSDVASKMVYLTDVKTRSLKSIPDAISTLPTQFQLFLYYQFLRQLILGQLPLQVIADRYELDVEETFSDEFIVQVGGIGETYQELLSSQGTDASFDESQDAMDLLLSHNNLSSLWDLMLSQLKEVFTPSLDPQVPGPPTSSNPSPDPASITKIKLSPILTATYLSSQTSEVIGHKVFEFDQTVLDTYLQDGMRWWKGERPAKGVKLAEVNRKCTWCEFRDDCEWLQKHDQENLQRAREKVKEKKIV